MSTTYPGSIDLVPDAPNGKVPLGASSPKHTEYHQKEADVLNAIQTTLGENPQGAYSTVADRIAAIAPSVFNQRGAYADRPSAADPSVAGYRYWSTDLGTIARANALTGDWDDEPRYRYLRGLASGRPAASALNSEHLYETTDTGARTVTRSDGSAWNELPLAHRDRQPINVNDRGIFGDGVTDVTAAIQALFDEVESWPTISPYGAGFCKPPIYFPKGVYNISNTLLLTQRYLSIVGDGSTATIFNFSGGDVPVFELGTFASAVYAPDTVWTGDCTNISFTGLLIRRPNVTSAPVGTRTGHGIRANGGGNHLFDDVRVQGFKYGINLVRGGQYCRFMRVYVSYCDTGLYLGPGSQQVTAIDLEVYTAYEGVVLERTNQAMFLRPTIGDCAHSLVTIENSGNVSRQLTEFPTSGTYGGNRNDFLFPYFESNATADPVAITGIPTYIVKVVNNTAVGTDPVQDTQFTSPFFVLNGNVYKTPTNLFYATGTGTWRNFFFSDSVFAGLISGSAFAGNNHIITDFRTLDGFTPPTLFDVAATGCRFVSRDGLSIRTAVGSEQVIRESQGQDANEGHRQTYYTNGIIGFSWKFANVWRERMFIDVQNAVITLGATGNQWAMERNTGPPLTAGGFARPVGSIRFNNGTAYRVVGWRCIRSASPGDWVPYGDIDTEKNTAASLQPVPTRLPYGPSIPATQTSFGGFPVGPLSIPSNNHRVIAATAALGV